LSERDFALVWMCRATARSWAWMPYGSLRSSAVSSGLLAVGALQRLYGKVWPKFFRMSRQRRSFRGRCQSTKRMVRTDASARTASTHV